MTGAPMLDAMARAVVDSGDKLKETACYEGRSDWLVLYGVGAPVNNAARLLQIVRGGRVLMWDMGYVGREKVVGHLRMSIDVDHPQRWLDQTPNDASRWERLRRPLREDSNPDGPILLVGLGRKSRAYLNAPNWERDKYRSLKTRFPGRRIIFRPKGRDHVWLPCESDATTPIDELLNGASLVVCRHSNVAVDAAIAGVPFEAEEGAAMWLQRRGFTPEARLEFLQRLAWWQWRSIEAREAWAFAKQVIKT